MRMNDSQPGAIPRPGSARAAHTSFIASTISAPNNAQHWFATLGNRLPLPFALKRDLNVLRFDSKLPQLRSRKSKSSVPRPL